MSEEVVDHPAHYGGNTPYEVIKVLRAWDLELAKGFCWGNVIKYTQRAGKKDGTVEDRRKANWYARELLSIESELVGKRKAELKKSEIPVVINGDGNWRLYIDWENHTHRLEKLNTGSSNAVGGAGGGTVVSSGTTYMTGGSGGSGATVNRCNSEFYGCHAGYHDRRCPMYREGHIG
jgi:hypothetical protein